jgi:uncharacterized membrane protein
MKSMFVRAQDPADAVPVPGAAVQTGEQPSVAIHRRRTRVDAVDLLRGLVMVLMAVDHTRDFVHAAAMNAPPEDLRSTTAAIFLTRWITHFCAPAFMFCAGLGVYFQRERGVGRVELSRFLLTRGVWLIVLEVTAVRMGFFFQIGVDPLILLVFWALGLAMIALAALVYLPDRAVFAISVAMIALHNLFDGVRPDQFGAFDWLWKVLHVQSLLSTSPTVILAYPLVPWIGVMGLGYVAGRVYRLAPQERRRLLLSCGIGMSVAFVALRALDVYGDPRPWSVQATATLTWISFLNTTKYPPSLLFLLMTLGPALVCLAWVDGVRVGERNFLRVFGRVPLFYFVLHIPLIHAVAIGLTWLRYGPAPFLLTPPPTLGTPRGVFPPDYGWDLWIVYAVCIGVVLLMYPVCLWFMRLKDRRQEWWLRYL